MCALLAAIAVPGFLRARARARSQATTIRKDARMIDGAIDQFAIEKNKRPGEAIRWENIVPYLNRAVAWRSAAGGTCSGVPTPSDTSGTGR